MARKSSFLQGFEVGTDLYNKGFERSQRTQQMKLQQDAQERRNQLIDSQLREAQERAKERARQRGLRDSAGVSFMALKDIINSPDLKTDEQRLSAFRFAEEKHLSDIQAHGDTYDNYKLWRDTLFEKPVFHASEENRNQERQLALIGLHNKKKLAEDNASLVLQAQKINSSFKPTTLVEANDPEGYASTIADATAIVTGEEIKGMYVKAGLPVPAELDVDGSGTVDREDVYGATGVISTQLEERAKRTAAAERQADLDDFQTKEDIKLRNDLLLEKAKNITAGQPIEESFVNDLAMSGMAVTTSTMPGQNALVAKVNQRRAEVYNQISDQNTPMTQKLQLSRVFGEGMGVDQRRGFEKAITVRDQIKGVESAWKSVDSGKLKSKFASVKKLFETDEGMAIQEMDGLLNAIIPNLARGIYGEVGVLTDNDIKNYKAAFVSIENPREVNEKLYEITKNLVDDVIVRKLEDSISARQNVSGYTRLYSDITGEPIYRESSSPTNAANPAQQGGMVMPRIPELKTSYRSTQDAENSILANAVMMGKTSGTVNYKLPGENGMRQYKFTRREVSDFANTMIDMGAHKGTYPDGSAVVHSMFMPNNPAPTQPAQDQPDPTPNQMAPTGTPEGQPAPKPNMEFNPNEPAEGPKEPVPGADQGVEGETEQEKESPYDPTLQERRQQRMSQYRKQSGASDEPAEGPKGPIPGADQGVEGEMEEAEDITPWESEEERQAMVDGQVKEYRAIQEFQKLADNGGGGDPYSFVRHRVKIGGTTGEIVRTNSRGVFIRIPNGPTRFMSWGGLSKRIESGDFKPNKARLNQQLKGE